MRMPIVMLSGPAGCGKDTVASYLVQNHGAVSVAQADPMKRLAAVLFGFTESQLWGPSMLRGASSCIPEWSQSEDHWQTLVGRFNNYAGPWIREVLPDLNDAQTKAAGDQLFGWLRQWNQAHAARFESPRRVLQTLGTEWGRAFSRNMWIDFALDAARKLLVGGHGYLRHQGIFELRDDLIAPVDLVVITDGRFRNEILAVRGAGGATVKIVCPDAGLTGEAGRHKSETEQNSIPDSWFDVVLTNEKPHGLATLERSVADLAAVLKSDTLRMSSSSVFPPWSGLFKPRIHRDR